MTTIIENEEITAINVFLEVGGKQYMAFINPEAALLFVGMLGPLQSGSPKEARLHPLPPSVAAPLEQTRLALYHALMSPKKGGAA